MAIEPGRITGQLVKKAIQDKETSEKLPRGTVRKQLIGAKMSAATLRHIEQGETIPNEEDARYLMECLPLPLYFPELCEEGNLLRKRSISFRRSANHPHEYSDYRKDVWIGVRRAVANRDVAHTYKIHAEGVRSESNCKGVIIFEEDKIVYLIHRKVLHGRLLVEFEIDPPASVTFGTEANLAEQPQGRHIPTHDQWEQRGYLSIALEYILKWYRESIRQLQYRVGFRTKKSSSNDNNNSDSNTTNNGD